eukprot:gene18042-23684_t
MISNDLLSVIANRKKYIDEVSEISTSHASVGRVKIVLYNKIFKNV